jgi:hypothetical protein
MHQKMNVLTLLMPGKKRAGLKILISSLIVLLSSLVFINFPKNPFHYNIIITSFVCHGPLKYVSLGTPLSLRHFFLGVN